MSSPIFSYMSAAGAQAAARRAAAEFDPIIEGQPAEPCRRTRHISIASTLRPSPLSRSSSDTYAAQSSPHTAEDATVIVTAPSRDADIGTEQQQYADVQLLPQSPVKPSRRPAMWQELQVVLLLALPTVITTAAQQIIIVTSQMFSGHIGTDEMAAAALGNTWWNLMWYVILGVSTALDTLGSQAIGAGNKPGLIVWTVAAAAVLTVVNIPMGVGLWYGGSVAQVFFGQGPEVSALTSAFSKWLLPGLWPMTMAQLLQKYLQTQGIVGPPAITSGLSIGVNILASWVGVTTMGLEGVALAATATRVMLLLSMIVAVAVTEAQPDRVCAWWGAEFWVKAGHSIRAALKADTLWRYLCLGIPGGLMLGLECASFEVTTAFAGYLGPAAVAAHAGVFALTSLCYIALPFALATAATIRVGNLLGAGRAAAARCSSRVVVALGTGFMAVCGVTIYMTRFKLGQMFTNGDTAVLTAVAVIAPLGAAYQVGDGVLGTSQGVLRGLGRQAQLMVLNTLCFWAVAVPLGWWLTFRAGCGLSGLWVGMATGCFLAASTSLILMLCVNWESEVAQAQGKIQAKAQQSDSETARNEQQQPLLVQEECV